MSINAPYDTLRAQGGYGVHFTYNAGCLSTLQGCLRLRRCAHQLWHAHMHRQAASSAEEALHVNQLHDRAPTRAVLALGGDKVLFEAGSLSMLLNRNIS